MNTIQQRKGKAEDKEPEVLLPEKLLLKSSVPKRREKNPFGKEDRPPCHSNKKGTCSCHRECAYWYLPHCKYFKTKKCRLGKDCLYVHSQAEYRSTYFQRRGEGKGSSEERSTKAIFSIASHQPGNQTRRVLSDLRLRRMLLGKPKATLSE